MSTQWSFPVYRHFTLVELLRGSAGWCQPRRSATIYDKLFNIFICFYYFSLILSNHSIGYRYSTDRNQPHFWRFLHLPLTLTQSFIELRDDRLHQQRGGDSVLSVWHRDQPQRSQFMRIMFAIGSGYHRGNQ